ncbi:MAG: isopenicillin N synthase family dioxygenase [Acidimicrobiales bacterium]
MTDASGPGTDVDVPVIDIAPFRTGTASERLEVAKEVDKACREIGFLTIVGHGIERRVIESCYSTARSFFDLSSEEKMAVVQPSPDQVRGYSAVGAEGLSYSLGDASPGDLKESFTIGPPDVSDDAYFHCQAAGSHFASNLWPDRPVELREAWLEYFSSMSDLSAILMSIFAVGLDLPDSFFSDTIDRHISMLRALNYPDQPDEPAEGQMRAGAHSDYGSLTILRQENAPGGLQVRRQDGLWVDVPVIEDSFVINIGDLMMQWTNDRWISTVHRVVNPPRTSALSSRRISLVFFHQPNYDAVISCLDSCTGVAAPAKYPPVTSGDHLLGKFLKQTTFGGTR